MRGTYDLVFGMGYACSCALALRAAKLQFESLPFDWTGYTKDLQLYPGDMPLKVRDICAGMPGKPFYEVKLAETAAALKEVAAVRDYRTPEERRRGRWAAVRKFLHLG